MVIRFFIDTSILSLSTDIYTPSGGNITGKEKYYDLFTLSLRYRSSLFHHHLSSIFDIDATRQWVIAYAAAGEIIAFTI